MFVGDFLLFLAKHSHFPWIYYTLAYAVYLFWKINSRLPSHIIFPRQFTKAIMFLESIKIFAVLWIMKATSYRTTVHLNCSNHISSSIVMLLFQVQQMTSIVFIIHLSLLISCAFAFYFSLSWDFFFPHGSFPVAKWWEFPNWSYMCFIL